MIRRARQTAARPESHGIPSVKHIRAYSPPLAALDGLRWRSPSFPHAVSGNPGRHEAGPPIKTFGGDGNWGVVRNMIFRHSAARCWAIQFPFRGRTIVLIPPDKSETLKDWSRG